MIDGYCEITQQLKKTFTERTHYSHHQAKRIRTATKQRQYIYTNPEFFP